MKNHPSFLMLVPMIAITGYLGYALATGSVRINGIAQPIRRRDSPREYWYYMRILLVVYGLLVGIAALAFL